MITKREFADLLATFIEDGVVREVQKTNTSYVGITLNKIDVPMPIINVDEYYEKFVKYMSNMGMDIGETIRNNTMEINMDILLDYELAKEYLTLRIMLKKWNEGKLMDIPHDMFGEFAVVPYVAYEDKAVAVTNRVLAKWDVTKERVFSDAKLGEAVLKEFNVFTMFDESLSHNLLDDPDTARECNFMYLTNPAGFHGSNVVLIPGILKVLYETLGREFWMIPSSVHEWIVVPTDGYSEEDKETLNGMVLEVNKTQVAKDEWLSDRVYFYNASKGELV